MKEINFISRNLIVLGCLVLLVFTSCEDEEGSGVVTAEVTSMVPLGDTETLNAGLPGELIRVEGANIGDTRSLLLDGKVNVIFNPALNSEKALFFNVPFNADRGSRFGTQSLTFIDKNGNSYSEEFTILQPAPTINSNNQFEPDRARGGEEITVSGQWYFNVTDVTINGESVGEFTVISENQVSFIFPEGATEAVELSIITTAGTATSELPIEGGFQTYLLTDFDGNGPIQGDWFSYGDREFEVASGLGRDGSIGAEIIWDGTGSNGFTGSGHSPFEPVTTSNDSENAFIVIDVNADGYPGTVFEFVITDDNSNTWLAKATPVEPESGWVTLEVRLSDFGFNYNPANQDNGDPDPSSLKSVSVQISQEGGAAPKPSGYRFDNLRLKVLEK